MICQAEIVDVDVLPAIGAVEAVLAKLRQDGSPLRNKTMEYVKEPKRSLLQQAVADALPQLGGRSVAEALVQELRVSGNFQTTDKAEVGAAVLCLMMGGMDEAHNLVTPHSQASPTIFGGPAKHGSTMKREASYCHIIVHRNEGSNPGEMGSGFKNSKYWISSTFPAGEIHPIWPALKQAAEELAEASSGFAHREARGALKSMGTWNPLKFNSLCEQAVECEDEEMLAWCSAVQSRELSLLFEHIVGKVPAKR